MGQLNVTNANITGTITKPSQCAFLVHLDQARTLQGTGVYLWNASSALNGNYFTSVDYNIGSHFNTGTSEFTAPESGLYHWWSILATTNTASAQNYTSTEYYINDVRSGKHGWQEMAAGYQQWHGHDVMKLTKGDVVTFGGETHATCTFSNQSSIGMYFLG